MYKISKVTDSPGEVNYVYGVTLRKLCQAFEESFSLNDYVYLCQESKKCFEDALKYLKKENEIKVVESELLILKIQDLKGELNPERRRIKALELKNEIGRLFDEYFKPHKYSIVSYKKQYNNALKHMTGTGAWAVEELNPVYNELRFMQPTKENLY